MSLFRCRSDVYALRWENRRAGRSGWMPAIHGYWRRGSKRTDANYLPLTTDVIDQQAPTQRKSYRPLSAWR
ncbi:TOTE conflict system archaeo-eukaryotic primase domain-containing protein [Mycobacterium kyorinense]|uniref:TOTE conflict system archaeo-eukaryotic primase domain-containing protein n=1 Tax=Mycobacterium kyorinense TaxID=487514 RepID=UPI003F6C148D